MLSGCFSEIYPDVMDHTCEEMRAEVGYVAGSLYASEIKLGNIKPGEVRAAQASDLLDKPLSTHGIFVEGLTLNDAIVLGKAFPTPPGVSEEKQNALLKERFDKAKQNYHKFCHRED
jgi:hypothetical protein